MARATFKIMRSGNPVGSFSFIGKSYDKAKAAGARYLRGLGVSPNPMGYKTLPRLIIGEAYKILRRRGVKVTPAVKKQVSEFVSRGYSAAQIAGAFPTPPPKSGINPRRRKSKRVRRSVRASIKSHPNRRKKNLSFGQRMARLRKKKIRRRNPYTVIEVDASGRKTVLKSGLSKQEATRRVKALRKEFGKPGLNLRWLVGFTAN